MSGPALLGVLLLLAGHGTARAQTDRLRASLSAPGSESGRDGENSHRLELSLGRSSPMDKDGGESGMSLGAAYLFHALPALGFGIGVERFSFGHENSGARYETTVLSYAALMEFVAFSERRLQPTLRVGAGGFNANIRERWPNWVEHKYKHGPAPLALVGLGLRFAASESLSAGLRATIRFMEDSNECDSCAARTLDISGSVGYRFGGR